MNQEIRKIGNGCRAIPFLKFPLSSFQIEKIREIRRIRGA